MHASTLPEITAGQKLQVVIDRLLEFRASQLDLLQQPGVTLQNLTTLNLVQVGVNESCDIFINCSHAQCKDKIG